MTRSRVNVARKLKDSEGFMLEEVTVSVTDKATGQTTTSQFKNGLLGFVGVSGRTYTLSVEDKNHRVQSQDVTIAADGGAEQNTDIVFGDQLNDKQVNVSRKLKDSQGFMLEEVTVTVTNKTTGEITRPQFKNSLLDFVGLKGQTYTITVEDKNHRVQSQDVTITDDAGADENLDLVFENNGDNIASTMIRLKNDGGGDKFYISTGNSNTEITERDGMLYLNDGTGEKKSR